ncbi:unnamed protein product [Ixodes hexagonus]
MGTAPKAAAPLPSALAAAVAVLASLASAVFRDCGFVTDQDRGVITTPGFPGPYPVPIECRWVIRGSSPKQRVALYLTQFYMRDGVSLSEYVYYDAQQGNIGGTPIGGISSEAEPTHVLSNKPVLVLDFQVREAGNIHLRVLDLFLEVYGFNVTYELVESEKELRNDSCLGHHCSFTGVCLASADLTSYRCSCLEDFYGDECQFSPRCGPQKGGSLCQNGGTCRQPVRCRYYIGSKTQTCVCPPEYKGAHCEHVARTDILQGETSSLSASLVASAFSTDCKQLNCSQLCNEAGPQPRCECKPGFRLDDDGRSCSPASRTRFLVQVKLYDRNVDLAHLDARGRSQLQAGLEAALRSLFASHMSSNVDNLAVLQFLSDAVVQFHVFGRKEDGPTVQSVLEEALKAGKLGPFTVDRGFLQLQEEPAMHVEAMEVSRTPRVGDELMVACMAVGSSALRVRWFKDGFPVDPDVPFRSLWTSLVPKNSKDQFTALLAIDRASTYDAGVFTCQVSDWGAVQNKSVRVRLDVAPHPLVSPLSLTLVEGQPLELLCLSLGGVPLGFRWLRNDNLLPPKGPERTEDLYPAGSRLVLGAARASATYTCVATGPLGADRADALVTVLAPHAAEEVCPPEESHGVAWQRTATHSRDVQRCPSPLFVEGQAVRPCGLSLERRPLWGSPDFSGCADARLAQLRWKLESLRMGYLVSSPPQLAAELRGYLSGRTLGPGEGQPLVSLLAGLRDYLDHPLQRQGGHPARAAAEAFWDVSSHLLSHKPLLLQDQTFMGDLQTHVLQFGLLAAEALTPGAVLNFDRPALVVALARFTRKSGEPVVVNIPVGGTIGGSAAWAGNAVQLHLSPSPNEEEDPSELLVAVALFKTLGELLPERFLARHGDQEDRLHELYSSLLGVALSKEEGVRVRVRLAHSRQGRQEAVCGRADLSRSTIHFLLDGCRNERRPHNESATWCSCREPGTFALLVEEPRQGLAQGDQESDLIAGLGCGACLVLVLVTLVVLLLRCCRHGGGMEAIQVQVCLSLCGAFLTLLQGVRARLPHSYFPYAVSALQLCLLAACCLQLCTALVLYMQLVDAHSVRHPALKVAALGWAVPVIVVGANLAAQVLEGFRLESWWLTLRTSSGHLSNYFCAFCVSLAIVTALHLLLFMTVRAELRRQKTLGTPRKQVAASQSGLLTGSMAILLALLGVSMASILYVNMEDSLRSYLLAATSSLLGLLVFFIYAVAGRRKTASPTALSQEGSSSSKVSMAPGGLSMLSSQEEAERLLQRTQQGGGSATGVLELPQLDGSPRSTRTQESEELGDNEAHPQLDPPFGVTAV